MPIYQRKQANYNNAYESIRPRIHAYLTSPFLKTTRALTVEFEQMPFYLKAGLARKAVFQLVKIAAGKIDDRAAGLADQVMVMSLRPSYKVATAAFIRMYAAYEVQAEQDFQCAVHRHQPDGRMHGFDALVNILRRHVVMAFRDDF